jgi:hypothetical protein
MRERDDFEVVIAFAIDEKEWEVAEANAANCFGKANPLHHGADFRVCRDHINRCFNLPPQAIAETGASALVPLNGLAKFAFGRRVRANGFRHR